MNFLDILLISVGLAIDAFAASVSIGLNDNKSKFWLPMKVALTFALFQVLMPMLGFIIAFNFNGQINLLTRFLSFLILGIIGSNMLVNKTEECESSDVSLKNLLLLGVATSLDAFAVGLTIAFLKANMVLSLVSIGLVTFILCFWGVLLGNLVENHFTNKARIMGGIILILIGLKILIGF
ncbi:MAG: manganese efflux pump [bacterium]|nr:manganese efflux pump [bacterium]